MYKEEKCAHRFDDWNGEIGHNYCHHLTDTENEQQQNTHTQK